MILHRAVLVLMCASLSSTVRILRWPPLNCSQQGLGCTVTTSNCMDRGWLDVNAYTPSSPEQLQVSVDTRQDETGHLQPVLVANWKIKDDGSIRYLKATEIHLLVTATNQNLCVRYSFKDKLPMRSPSGEKWSFSANMLVLEPGHRYRVSVFNIPKPEWGHSSYDVSADLIVPDCPDPTMQRTQFCTERGSLWQPNISLAQINSALAVSFSPDTLCEDYIIIIRCSNTQHVERTYKTNQTTLDVTFSLDKWPRSCCQFDAEIKPLFPQCGQDCARRRKTLNICPGGQLCASLTLGDVMVSFSHCDCLIRAESDCTAGQNDRPVTGKCPGAPDGQSAQAKPSDPPKVLLCTSVVLGVVIMCVIMAVIMYAICRKADKPGVAPAPEGGEKPWQKQLNHPPKVLVIYSQDHHLYRDIVLKLCAFLQAKCGTKVLVDLLDSTSVGMVGRLRWLEWQRQQLKNPSDKILVLCSRGVQAKWRAMCGQGRVTLREDILSPTDDMLTPFLNLFLPDIYQAGMLGKYMVAYFNDISCEQDVPSVFDIAVKYKLMKHFEELYFRILDIEKYQPGQVNHIEGISGDEYFNCASGGALKNAIETFQAYQLENPDWFEKECVDGEEKFITEANMLIAPQQIPPVLESVPLIRNGLPVYIHEVKINGSSNSGHVLTPELNTERNLLSVVELTSEVNPQCKYQYPSNLDEVLTDHVYPHNPSPESVYIVEPVLNKPPASIQNWLSLMEEPLSQIPTEGKEEDSLLPMSKSSTHSDQRSSVLQNSLDSNPSESSCASMEIEYFPLSEISHSQPVEMDEYEVLEPSEKRQSSGSDQGYISKTSSQHESPFKEDPLVALSRLQEELFQRNLRYYDLGPGGN